MIAGLGPYPAYRHSGVEWIGDVPEHWRAVRAKWLFAKVERPSAPDDDVVTCFRDGTVTRRRNRRESGFTESVKELGYQGVRRGDLVIHAMDAFAGACGVSDSDGKSSPVYSVCTPRESTTNPHYFASLVREMARNRWILALARGVRERSTDFRFPAFEDQVLPVPPTGEQDTVAQFLNAADRRIRRIITAKEKRIALLEQQKQAIIDQAVTGQIDVRTGRPYAAYRASKVTSVGSVPVHWQECRLRDVVSTVTTGSRSWSSYAADDGPLFIRVANLSRGSLALRFSDVVRLDLSTTTETGRTRISAGDILLSVTAYIGSVGIAPKGLGEAYVSQHVARCKPKPGSCSQWLGYVLLSKVGQTHGNLSLYGGTKDGLSLDDVKNYPILLPPCDEQEAATGWIEDQSKTILRLCEAAVREIALAREFRTRLIADVVTGKLDVREAAAALPDAAST